MEQLSLSQGSDIFRKGEQYSSLYNHQHTPALQIQTAASSFFEKLECKIADEII